MEHLHDGQASHESPAQLDLDFQLYDDVCHEFSFPATPHATWTLDDDPSSSLTPHSINAVLETGEEASPDHFCSTIPQTRGEIWLEAYSAGFETGMMCRPTRGGRASSAPLALTTVESSVTSSLRIESTSSLTKPPQHEHESSSPVIIDLTVDDDDDDEDVVERYERAGTGTLKRQTAKRKPASQRKQRRHRIMKAQPKQGRTVKAIPKKGSRATEEYDTVKIRPERISWKAGRDVRQYNFSRLSTWVADLGGDSVMFEEFARYNRDELSITLRLNGGTWMSMEVRWDPAAQAFKGHDPIGDFTIEVEEGMMQQMLSCPLHESGWVVPLR